MIDIREYDGELDEIVFTRDGKCLFHLEQMSDQYWWMAIYDGERTVHIDLMTKRAVIHGSVRKEGIYER